jgi:hypothetical protein
MKRATNPPRVRAETPAQWLDELAAALHLPFERSEAIREELAEHLRERIRDLQLEGLNEPDATVTAVRELGDAAAVARRFRKAEQSPLRRTLMNLAVIGIAGAALATSVIALSAAPTPPASTPQPANPEVAVSARARLDSALAQAEVAAAEIIASDPLRLQAALALARREPAPLAIELAVQLDERAAHLELVPAVRTAPIGAAAERLDAVLDALAQRSGLRAMVRWPLLEQVGHSPDQPVTLAPAENDLAAAVAAINESQGVFDRQDQRWIDVRVNNGVAEFAPRSYFDTREATVVRYDVAPLLASGITADELRELIVQFVEPNLWADNGGGIAQIKHVGGKLFVKAPPRVHESVRWYIEQLSAGKQTSRGGDAILKDLPMLSGILAARAYVQFEDSATVQDLADAPTIARIYQERLLQAAEPAAEAERRAAPRFGR